MANGVDRDHMPHYSASDLVLCYLLGPACPNTEGKYGDLISLNLSEILNPLINNPKAALEVYIDYSDSSRFLDYDSLRGRL